MTNKYPGRCSYCGGHVARNAGKCWKPKGARRFSVAHLACSDSESPQVTEVYLPSTGTTLYQNKAGRCEDAPCCGCCTF